MARSAFDRARSHAIATPIARRATALLLLAALMQLGTFLSATPAQGMSCAAVSEVNYLRDADAVFTGRVIDRVPSRSRDGDPIITVLFDVMRVYKGVVQKKQYVVSRGGGAGGVVSSVDIDYRAPRWLVYAHDRSRDGFYAPPCSGTRPLREGLPPLLGEGSPPAKFEPLPAPHGLPGTPPIEVSIDEPTRGPVPWLAGGGVGVLLLALPGCLALRFRRSWRPQG